MPSTKFMRLFSVTSLAAGVAIGAAGSWRVTEARPPTMSVEASSATDPSTSGAEPLALDAQLNGRRGAPGLSSLPSSLHPLDFSETHLAPELTTKPRALPTRSEAASSDELLGLLRGLSGKTNKERQLSISGELFPTVGLSDWGYQPVPVATWWGGEYGAWDDLSNIYAVRHGTLPDGVRRTIIVGGHFDKVTYPGRSPNPSRSDGILDNGSGVATLALVGGTIADPQNDIVFIAFAAEEPPPFFNGSKQYFRDMSRGQRSNIAAYINMDVLGRGRLAAVNNSTPALAAAASTRMSAEGIRLDRVPVSTNNNSDHLSAMAWGIPSLALTCTDYTARNIHVPEDNMSAINGDALYQQYLGARLAVMALDDWAASGKR